MPRGLHGLAPLFLRHLLRNRSQSAPAKHFPKKTALLTMKIHSALQATGLLAISSIAVLLTSGASAQTNYSAQNFNTNDGYVRGMGIIALSQPPALRWQGNDPYNTNTFLGETDLVARVAGYTPAPLTGNSSVTQGGGGAADDIFPGTTNVQIWKSFNAYSNYAVVSFTAEWSIIASDPLSGFTNADSFAFDLRNAANSASLLKLQFTPGIATIPNAYTMESVSAAGTANLFDLAYGSLFSTQVDITGSTYSISLTEIDRITRSNIVTYTNYASGTLLGGLTSDDWATIAIDWNLASGDNLNPGSNFIVVNDVQAVPEPSTYALLALSAAAAGFMFRRRRA